MPAAQQREPAQAPGQRSDAADGHIIVTGYRGCTGAWRSATGEAELSEFYEHRSPSLPRSLRGRHRPLAALDIALAPRYTLPPINDTIPPTL